MATVTVYCVATDTRAFVKKVASVLIVLCLMMDNALIQKNVLILVGKVYLYCKQ